MPTGHDQVRQEGHNKGTRRAQPSEARKAPGERAYATYMPTGHNQVRQERHKQRGLLVSAAWPARSLITSVSDGWCFNKPHHAHTHTHTYTHCKLLKQRARIGRSANTPADTRTCHWVP
eukprot:1161935-Pelagomonas_calceolata.AAC.1